MRNKTLTAICFVTMLLTFTLFSPTSAKGEVNVSVQLSLPFLVMPGPPGMVVIPNTYVYYPPEVDENIFFYRGCWYRPLQGQWFKAPHYNGPWDPVVIKQVPRSVLAVPAGYRYSPASELVSYGQVKKNWRKWERNHYWDKGRH